MSGYKVPGHGWGPVGHRLRSLSEMHQWSYPIASRQKHRTIVMEHRSEEGGLMTATTENSEKIPEEPPQDGEVIVDYCCGFPVWGKRAPVTKRRLFPFVDPWIEESSR